MRSSLPRPYPLLVVVGTILAAIFLLVQPTFAANEQVRGQLNNWGNTPWSMSSSLGGTFIYVSDQTTAASDPNSGFKFFKDPNLWYGNNSFINFGAIYNNFSTAGGDSSFSHIQNRHYVFKWNGSNRGVVFQLSAAPVAVTGVSQSPAVPTDNQAVIVTATTSAAPPAEQALWLRYAINGNWAGSPIVKMSGTGTTYTATIPVQTVGTQISYYVFSSGDVAAVASGDADLMSINADTNSGSNYNYTVLSGTPATISDARAFWLNTTTFGWNGASATSYRLLYDPDGGLVPAIAQATVCTLPLTDPCHINLTHSGNIVGFPKNPNATGLMRLINNSVSNNLARELLRGQVAVASYDGGGILQDITGVQHQSVLDHLYVDNGTAASATLGVTYSGDIPTVRLWAPTAQSVTLRRFADSTTTTYTTHTMTRDNNSGVWSITGDNSWDRQFYMLDVAVYVPSEDEVVNNLVTDPYAVSLSTDSLRSQFVNLNDTDIQPTGWNSLTKPTLNSFTDITIYEMHVRDFSINDPTVAETDRGTYMAFTYDGNVNTLSDGMEHLLALQDAGLTHVHLLPVFDIATVPEANVSRDVWPNPTGFARNSDQQQAIIGANRANDGFNWGYDPFHYGVPEGSYATDPDGAQRILEFRQMVQVLNENGLRVVMDVVYNHTAASGQGDKSVLDKVVPGYYHRYDNNGVLYDSSCCDDTATEYAMMEKLMLDTLVRFAVDYKVDGFRFDLMNLHTRQNMINVQAAINAIDPTIYLYGEGWTFGSAQAKGLTNCPHCFADKYNMGGAGIGLFNDIIRDAAHGGYQQDPNAIRQQGFINGLSYDWNGYNYPNRFQSHLHDSMNTLRSGLRASGTDWSGAGAPFATTPHESIPYISKHDNETLFDQNVFKMPTSVSMDERVRAQNLGLSLMAFSQGVPFFHMASDILRSKSLDRNSYDSGDWFNRVYWDYSQNNFGVGLPPEWDNQSRWGIMGPHLVDTSLDPSQSDIEFTAAHFRELLRIRQSSPLFRLTTMAEVNNQVSFLNGDNDQDALIVMALSNNGQDPTYETILVFFNADKFPRSFPVSGASGFALDPIPTDGVDDDPVIVNQTDFDEATGTFTIPARTTAVFVSTQAITPPPAPSTLDWVGLMWPRGSVSHAFDVGSGADFDVYVQVYEEGITDSPGQGAGIDCFLHWGQYGEAWSDIQMSYQGDIGDNDANDEYVATIPAATLSSLTPGTYGFTAYCKKSNEDGRFWKQDSNDDQADGLITIMPAQPTTLAPEGGTFVHLFEWPWSDIEKECSYLGQMGYTAVQVSPPMEHVIPVGPDYPWWVRYQPVTHDTTLFNNRSGTLTQFQSMINTCASYGVDIYVDAVINHTTGVGSGSGTHGSTYTEYDYPQYGPGGFHYCGTNPGQGADEHNINDYSNRYEVQNCELVNLADLRTGSTTVRQTLHTYLQNLLDMGVTGFRIDAAKHMPAHDVYAILNGLQRPDGSPPYIFQEVIEASHEPVKAFEYTPSGAVTEFRYSEQIGNVFNCGGFLSTLNGFESGFLSSPFAVVFTDNHDNQRGHGAGGACILDHRNGYDLYSLGNIFMLAYPYGYPKVMSSYYWSNNPNSDTGDDKGPPGTNDGGTTWGAGLGPDTRSVYAVGQVAGDDPAHCADSYEDGKWVCEHRRAEIVHMVQFRAVTAGEAVTNWWADGDHIAFGRGDKGFVAINRTGSNATTTYATSLVEGDYCDIISGQRTADGSACTGHTITVNSTGQIVGYTLNSMTAFAIHAQSMVGTPQLAASQDFDLAISGSDTVTATLLTHDGLPVVGQDVGFVLVAGEGSVAQATAVTNNNGEAVITYNAPNTVTVAIVEATYVPTAGSDLTGLTAVYVGYRSDVSQLRTERLPTGTVSIGLGGTLTVTKQGSGTPLMTLAIFNDNPQSNQPGGSEKSAFVDIYLPAPTGVDSLTVVLDCATACDAPDKVWWGDPVSGDWLEVDSVTFDNNQATFTITASSSPSLADLSGTPFVVSENQPTAVTLAAIGVGSGSETAVMPWLLLWITAVLLTIAISRTRRA